MTRVAAVQSSGFLITRERPRCIPYCARGATITTSSNISFVVSRVRECIQSVTGTANAPRWRIGASRDSRNGARRAAKHAGESISSVFFDRVISNRPRRGTIPHYRRARVAITDCVRVMNHDRIRLHTISTIGAGDRWEDQKYETKRKSQRGFVPRDVLEKRGRKGRTAGSESGSKWIRLAPRRSERAFQDRAFIAAERAPPLDRRAYCSLNSSPASSPMQKLCFAARATQCTGKS